MDVDSRLRTRLRSRGLEARPGGGGGVGALGQAGGVLLQDRAVPLRSLQHHPPSGLQPLQQGVHLQVPRPPPAQTESTTCAGVSSPCCHPTVTHPMVTLWSPCGHPPYGHPM
eukprot:1181997-Prorocentrum_minimum.AAC.2